MERLCVLQVHCKDKRKKRRKGENKRMEGVYVHIKYSTESRGHQKETIIRHYTTLPDSKDDRQEIRWKMDHLLFMLFLGFLFQVMRQKHRTGYITAQHPFC